MKRTGVFTGRALGAAISLCCAGAPAAERARVYTPLDVMIEAPEMAGQRVRLLGAEVYGLSFSGGFVKAPGGFIYLRPPWRDRADLGFLLHRCEGPYRPDNNCAITIDGTVGEGFIGGAPWMTDVNFLITSSEE